MKPILVKVLGIALAAAFASSASAAALRIGVAIRKELLRRRGALESAAIRAPGAKLDESTRLALDMTGGGLKTNSEASKIKLVSS